MRTLTESAILYEDNHLLVLNKEPGLLTQPVPKDGRDSLEEIAKHYIKSAYGKPGNVYLHAVHRIDRQVSGVVIFARTDKALSRLNRAMRERHVTKIYHALVEGEQAGKAGQVVRLKNYISHRDHFAEVSESRTADSREASLSYAVLKYSRGLSLLEIQLDTGRYHQIRAQLAFAGHPVLGDRRYGSSADFGSLSAIGLHSRCVRFPHPVKPETIDLVAEYPPSWQALSRDLLSWRCENDYRV